MEAILRCHKCNLILIPNHETLSPKELHGKPICTSCCPTTGYAIDLNYSADQKCEFLKASCSHSAQNGIIPGATSINKKTFQTNCLSCSSTDISTDYDLRNQPARLFLEIQLSDFIDNQNLPKHIRRKLAATDTKNVETIWIALRRCMRYFFDNGICEKHGIGTNEIDRETLRHVCERCPRPSFIINLDFNEEASLFINEVIEKLRNASTDLFNKSILIYLKSYQITLKDINALFYNLSEIWPIKNCQLTINSRCLNCSKRFNVDNLPITVHQNPSHEICLKCFGRVSCCPVDGRPFCGVSLVSPEFLFVKQEFYCDFHEENIQFFETNLPYKTQCMHNICSNCVSSQSNLRCRKCFKNIDKMRCKENKYLKKKINFFEVTCSAHNKPCYNYMKDSCEPACDECRSRVPVNIKEFASILSASFRANQELDKKISKSIKEKFEFLPLRTRVELLKQEMSYSCYYRFGFNTNLLYHCWFESGFSNKFNISADAVFNIFGFFICRSYTSDSTRIEIMSDNERLNIVQEDCGGYFIFAKFDSPLLVDKQRFFNLSLGRGKYYAGDQLYYNNIYNKFFIGNHILTITFITKNGGDMNFGGPLIGISAGNFIDPNVYSFLNSIR